MKALLCGALGALALAGSARAGGVWETITLPDSGLDAVYYQGDIQTLSGMVPVPVLLGDTTQIGIWAALSAPLADPANGRGLQPWFGDVPYGAGLLHQSVFPIWQAGYITAIDFGFANLGPGDFDGQPVAFTLTATPEPATWGLMLAGLGVAGWRLRRRQSWLPVVQTAG